MKKKKIYLAIPYTGICELSYNISLEITAKLMEEGYVVFSPIIHSHEVAKQYNLPQTWEFWGSQDLPFIDWADELWVVLIGDNGFELVDKSTGVKAEVDHAYNNKKFVNYIVYNGKLLENVY
jgi:hypothetical protein